MKPYKQTTFDPGCNLFVIALDDEGNQIGIGRCDTIANVRHLVHENWKAGHRSEVAVLGLSQVEAVMKRVLRT